MKLVKGLVVGFILTFALACSGISALNYVSYVGIIIPAGQWPYYSAVKPKYEKGTQYVEHIQSTANRAMQASMYGGTMLNPDNPGNSPYFNLSRGNWNVLGGSGYSSYGTADGATYIRLRTKYPISNETAFSGTWALDYSTYEVLN